MLGFLLICLPVFGVIALGWAAGRFGWLSREAMDALGGFAFWYALPALLLRLLAAQPLAQIFDLRFFLGYAVACLALFCLALAAAFVFARRGLAVAAAYAGGAGFGNVGYLGPPLLLALFGERAAGPVALVIMAEVTTVIALASVLMAAAQGGGSPWRQVARALLLNPVIIAIGIGIAVGASGLPLPVPVDRLLVFLGGAAGPVALFALGGVLGRLRIRPRLLKAAAAMSFGKLVAYPALAWLVLTLVGAPPFFLQCGTLLAALPTASNAFILAQRYGTETEAVSATVLLTSVIAALTFPTLAWLLSAG